MLSVAQLVEQPSGESLTRFHFLFVQSFAEPHEFGYRFNSDTPFEENGRSKEHPSSHFVRHNFLQGRFATILSNAN